jgi:hypothetical protein
VRRLLALAGILALVCAGAALAAGKDPQKRHVAADMAKARSVVLHAADLGAGWKSAPSNSNESSPRCASYDPDESDLVETGTADSPQFELSTRYVLSSAALYKTAAQAQASWNRVTKPGLLPCLASVFGKGAQASGVRTRVLSSGAIAFPKLALRTAAYRIAFVATTSGLQLHGSVDLILLGKGRVDSVMISVAFGTPPLADETRLARLVARRL